MKTSRGALVCMTCLLVIVAPYRAPASEVQIFSLTPVGEHSCIAVPIDLDEGESLSGISWLNNDSSQPFPKLLLMEGLPGTPPDLGETGLILREVTGEVLQWGDVDLDVPVTSSTGFIYAVRVFPPDAQTTGQGLGQGPGIGIEAASSAAPFFLSGDGENWIEYSRNWRLCVEPMVSGGAARAATAPVALSDLAKGVEYVPGAAEKDSLPRLPTATALHPPRPNPFNPRTRVSWDLAAAARVSLKVFDVRGRLVRTLQSGEQSAGFYEVEWLGDDDHGAAVSSGVYFVRFEAGGYARSERVTLVR